MNSPDKTPRQATLVQVARFYYEEGLSQQAIADRLAEAAAEWLHRQARIDWGYETGETFSPTDLLQERYRGIRPAFGYPACPEMSDQETLFKLLEPERIGCRLTENWQIDPEQSTSALVVHHPDAAYFSA